MKSLGTLLPAWVILTLGDFHIQLFFIRNVCQGQTQRRCLWKEICESVQAQWEPAQGRAVPEARGTLHEAHLGVPRMRGNHHMQFLLFLFGPWAEFLLKEFIYWLY